MPRLVSRFGNRGRPLEVLPILSVPGLESSNLPVEREKDERKKVILRALLDDHSRLILTSTILRPKSVVEITREHAIPITSAYRKVKELKQFGLLRVDRIIVTEDGKKSELVRSAIRAASVRFDKGILEVDMTANLEADEKMVKRFFTLREVK